MGESVSRRYARYTSLSVLSMIGLGLYYLADTFFVANKIGTTGLAALNYSIPMYYVINGTGLLLGVGGATRFTIHKSRNETAEGNQVFTNMVVLGALISVAVFRADGILFGRHRGNSRHGFHVSAGAVHIYTLFYLQQYFGCFYAQRQCAAVFHCLYGNGNGDQHCAGLCIYLSFGYGHFWRGSGYRHLSLGGHGDGIDALYSAQKGNISFMPLPACSFTDAVVLRLGYLCLCG